MIARNRGSNHQHFDEALCPGAMTAYAMRADTARCRPSFRIAIPLPAALLPAKALWRVFARGALPCRTGVSSITFGIFRA